MKHKFIICQRTLTYDVEQLVDEYKASNDGKTPSDQDIWEMVQVWAHLDLMSPPSRHDIRWLDEDGNEIE